MTDFEHPLIKRKNLEELIDGLVDKESGMPTAVPGSVMHELVKAAIQAKMVEELARPRSGPVWRSAPRSSVRSRPLLQRLPRSPRAVLSSIP